MVELSKKGLRRGRHGDGASILRFIGNATSSLHALVRKSPNRRRRGFGICPGHGPCRLCGESAGGFGDAGAGSNLPGRVCVGPAAAREWRRMADGGVLELTDSAVWMRLRSRLRIVPRENHSRRRSFRGTGRETHPTEDIRVPAGAWPTGPGAEAVREPPKASSAISSSRRACRSSSGSRCIPPSSCGSCIRSRPESCRSRPCRRSCR
jgi:hypothetical protein